MIFKLAQDFRDAVAAMPSGHPKHRMLELLEEALRRDIHFIARHPTTLFQCLWNTCWWYDCPEAASYYLPSPAPGNEARGEIASDLEEHRGNSFRGPWEYPDDQKLCRLMERWRQSKERGYPGFAWLAACRPPPVCLGTAQVAVLRGHEGGVTSVTYSPDGRRIGSASGDMTVRIWETEGGQELQCLRGHRSWITSVAYSPLGRWIATGSADKTVRVWDVETGQAFRCFPDLLVRDVAWSPDGRRVVSGSAYSRIRVWDLESGQEICRPQGHEGTVLSVAYSPDGRRIVSGSTDKTVRVWDAESGEQLLCLRGHESDVMCVACSPDGRRIVSGSTDKTVRVWDAQSGQQLRSLRGHEGDVMRVAYRPDGCHIISGSKDRTIRVWEAESGLQLCCLRGHEKYVSSVVYSPDGVRIVSGSEDHTVRVWNTGVGQDVRYLRGHQGDVSTVTYSPDGGRIVTGSEDQTVRVWDTESGQEIRCLRGHEQAVGRVAFCRDGGRIVSESAYGVCVWDAESGQEIRRWYRVREYLDIKSTHYRDIDALVWEPEIVERRVATAASDFALIAETIKSLKSAENPRRATVAFDSRRLSGVSAWDVETGEDPQVIRRQRDASATARAATGLYACPVLSRQMETAIKRSTDDQVASWFPAALRAITAHPTKSTWAGVSANHLYIIKLEVGNSP